jgi:quercetin dioxygenase-like cupin family protein
LQTTPHTHPFDVRGLVTQGEMWQMVGGEPRRLLPGDTFELARGVEHAERFGAEGATSYWVARRSQPSA